MAISRVTANDHCSFFRLTLNSRTDIPANEGNGDQDDGQPKPLETCGHNIDVLRMKNV